MFRRLTISFALLFLVFSGCVISPRRGTTNTGNSGTGQIYVANESGNAILRFKGATAVTGNVTPTTTISGASTQLSSPRYIFLDSGNDRLYVANTNAGNILVFNSVSTLIGSVSPSPARVISSPSLSAPADVAVDTSRDLLYVADNAEVAVFTTASTANGSTTAARVIQLGFTPSAMLLDAGNDRLFLANAGSNEIDIFDTASTLTGSVSPPRALTGSGTQLSQPAGLAKDGSGRLVVSNASPPSITIYANAASITGAISPVGAIDGSNTQLSGPGQLALDPTTNSGELYVADPTGGNVSVFSNLATVNSTINLTPSRSLSGPNTNLNTAKGVALDTTR
jgi:DNA-binding beta-propeller fold protein YncE